MAAGIKKILSSYLSHMQKSCHITKDTHFMQDAELVISML
jgi:hypothetical protein